MVYVIPFLRLITISLSSLGSSVYLQNRFCQSYWCIMHWHQQAYFYFNNTENVFNIKWFLYRSLWQNESSTEMIKQRLVSGHVSSVCLSKPFQRGLGNERALWLQGISPNNAKSLSFPAPPHPWRCVRIQCLSQYPKATSRSNNKLAPLVLSPVIFTMSWSSVLDHSQLL